MSHDQAVLDALAEVSDLTAPHLVRHYLYVPTRDVADSIQKELEQLGFRVEVRIGALGGDWLVLASHQIVPLLQTLTSTRELMESLVDPANGEYDGWEAEVRSH